ncbi:thiamine ABC transporter ATP-binding protein [Vibrio agarivorans]|uniref:thiamine ABC transporter ATP-binding protein n=1 Tax=Vibrio agarivorans TaxID=153622 RepID=UPI0022304C45|nr:thiamine ABC transporter ATP-binding protein [Vibrio agarivorans]MDN3661706.1 thiamine ABC transporter ATP-binding protein [Vibrio agarivorans]
MLSITNVLYEYHQQPFHFDLQVDQGAIVALMGPSGAGKSTLLALVAGFIEPAQGEISVLAQRIDHTPPHRRPLAMLFQDYNLFAHLSVRDNISLGLNPSLKLTQQQKQQVELAANQVGIGEYLERLPEQLSGGQKQRVALARCFVQPHPIWLLDEPFSALDPVLREEMLLLVASLAEERGTTVLMVTHHLSDAKSIASHFAFVANAKVEVSGEISELNGEHPHSVLAEFVAASAV